MLKSLAIKELRESAGIVVIALLAVAYVLSLLTGVRLMPPFFLSPTGNFPFIYDGFATAFVLVIGALAIGLGLKQSVGESRRGTYYFLLHQPARRTSIFGTKLLVGIAAVLIVGALLILVYALWSATPGHASAPFYWSMTSWAWQAWFSMPLLYLGAFLSGIRPARWFGTRLMPLVAAGFTVFLIAMISQIWLAFAAAVASAVLLVVCIIYYAEYRDY
jgi:hypothetical protein